MTGLRASSLLWWVVHLEGTQQGLFWRYTNKWWAHTLTDKEVRGWSFASQKIQLPARYASVHYMSSINIIATPSMPKMQLVTWIPPWEVGLTLIAIEPIEETQVWLGGFCRSSVVNIVFSFYEYYGVQSSLVAKTRAVLSGLKYLSSFPIFCTVTRASLSLVQILRGEALCPWYLQCFIQSIRELHDQYAHFIYHIYCEGNFVIDGLANKAVDQQDSKLFHEIKVFPKHIQGAAVMND